MTRLPGVYIQVESGLGFQPVPARRVGLVVDGDVSWSRFKVYKSWKEVEADTSILPTAKKLLYDFYANGGGEVVVYAFQSTATDWAGYQTDLINAINSLLAWRDADGVGIEFYVVPLQALTPPATPTDADWQGLVSAIGTTNSSIWDAQQYPVFALVDARPRATGETIADYVSAVATASQDATVRGNADGRVAVFLSLAKALNPDATTEIRTSIMAIAGKLASFPIHHSIGWVEKGALKGALEVHPKDSETDYLDEDRLLTLHDAHVNALRLYPGFGIVPVYDWMLAPDTSDYQNIRYRRIMDESIRRVQMAFRPFINSPGVSGAALEALKAALKKPLDEITVSDSNPDAPIQAYSLALEPDPDVLTNGIIHTTLRIVPVGTKTYLDATFKLVKEV